MITLLLLAAGTWVAGAAARQNLVTRYPPPGDMVDVGGFKMHLRCTGSGAPTVILIAGLDDFSITWSEVQPEAAADARVCSYDRAGLGWSEASPDARTLGNMVGELHRLLVNAHVQPPYILAAHSFGGPIARLYIDSHPDEVVGLVLVDAAPTALFDRIPAWSSAIEGKIKMFQVLARMNSLGLLALVPQSVPNRGFPDEALAQYRAISAATGYWSVAVAENQLFRSNLAELGAQDTASLGDMPMVVLSRGLWDPMPGFSEAQNRQAES
ncbi:MAG TPA: alpha/beta hydrolase, partial [Anaerolineales bacterium]